MLGDAQECLSHTPKFLRHKKGHVVPVAVIPLDDMEGLMEQIATALGKRQGNPYIADYFPESCTVLECLGILLKKRQSP